MEIKKKNKMRIVVGIKKSRLYIEEIWIVEIKNSCEEVILS